MATRNSCIFCRIASKQECKFLKIIFKYKSYSLIKFLFLSATTILYEEENYVVFNDIRPAAEFHILIIPKKHYRSIQHLKKSDVKMIKEMAEIGYKLLEEKSSFSKDNTNELLEGFHWPIASVGHLHLHFIAPKQQMNCFKEIEFNSLGFGSWQQAVNKLEAISDEDMHDE